MPFGVNVNALVELSTMVEFCNVSSDVFAIAVSGVVLGVKFVV